MKTRLLLFLFLSLLCYSLNAYPSDVSHSARTIGRITSPGVVGGVGSGGLRQEAFVRAVSLSNVVSYDDRERITSRFSSSTDTAPTDIVPQYQAPISLDQPDPYITDLAWSAQRNRARKLTATWFRIVLGSKELKDPNQDKLGLYGKQQLDRVLVPLKLEGFSLHVTLAGNDYGCLADIISYIKALGIPCEIDPCNEDPALKPGATHTQYTARMRWLQGQLAGTSIGGLTGVHHGWFADWTGTRNADTADFGQELKRHLAQIDYVYTPGSEIRAVSGWAKFTTNLYVSRDQTDLGVKLALITKARSIERHVHGFQTWGGYNRNSIVLAEFGVWLPEPSKAYSHAFSTGAAIREVRSWPGVHRVTIYAPWNDPFYSIGGTDQASVSRVNGYARGLGL